MVSKLNAAEPVHVSRLLDEAWAESIVRVVGSEAPLDCFKAFLTYLRPPPSLSSSLANPPATGAAAAHMRMHEDYLNRFERFYALACDVAVSVIASATADMMSELRCSCEREWHS